MSVAPSDIPERMKETLIDIYGETQESRYRGFFISQSIRELIDSIEDKNIIQLEASRSVTAETSKVPVIESAYGNGSYFTLKDKRKVNIDINYDKKKHGMFNSDAVLELLDQEPTLGDIPVKRFVHRFESDDLEARLNEVLDDVLGIDPWWVEQPFYVVLESRPAGNNVQKQKVRDYHGEEYFKNGENGYGWKVRTMDLVSFWTKRGWVNPSEVVATSGSRKDMTKFTIRDIEDPAFNHISKNDLGFGMAYSPLLINKWRRAFGRNRTDLKSWVWERSEGWIRTA